MGKMIPNFEKIKKQKQKQKLFKNKFIYISMSNYLVDFLNFVNIFPTQFIFIYKLMDYKA